MQNLEEYPYTKNNLFKAPEKYSYAFCSQENYVNLWEKALTVYRDRLISCNYPEHKKSPSQDIAVFFNSLLKNYQSNKISALELKEAASPFIKKYEVFKRLFSSYDHQPRKKHNATPCTTQSYVIFAEVLLSIVESLNDLKCLSCLLKLTDALCSIDVEEYNSESADKMARIITQEIILVEKLNKQ